MGVNRFANRLRQGGVITAFILVSFLSAAQYDTIAVNPDTLTETHPVVAEEKSHFSEVDDTLTIELRSVPDEALKRIENEDEFWYANSDLKKSREQLLEERERAKRVKEDKNAPAFRERKSLASQEWFQQLLWIIIVVGFIFFLIIYLGNSNVGLFRKKVEGVNDAVSEAELEDIFSINYEREIQKAISESNYRLAVRLQFLKLLKKMADTNRIKYKQDKTNFDYLVELQKTNYYNQFFKVTRDYEYSWYGQFPLTEDAYRVIENDFKQMDSQLGSR